MIDTLPNGVTINGNWSCALISGTGSCITGQPSGTTATGTGDIDQLIDIASDAVMQFTVPVIYSSNPADY